MTYPQSTPYPPSMADNIAYAQDVVDKIMRNNPLVGAVIPNGLMKWYGNYTNPDGSKVNFLWIGEFFPGDPNLGGKPQRGFSLVRDDGTHSSALALFDRNPSGPLVQTISIGSWDGQPILQESRSQGGMSFPRQQIPLGRSDGIFANYPKCPSASLTAMMEGRFSGVGDTLHYRIWALSDSGTTGQIRIKVQDGATVIAGPWNAIPSAGNQIFDATIDVTSVRGHLDASIFLEGQTLSGAGAIYGTVLALTNYST
jgi:hypothetical protein